MKFLPEEKNKKIWSLVLLLVSVAGIIYFNFTAKAPAPPGSYQTPVSSTESNSAKTAKSGLLPYGSKIDVKILEADDFKVLRAAPPLVIGSDEMGRDDLFSEPSR